MRDLTILTMSHDVEWTRQLWTEARSIGRARVVATESMAEACDLLSFSHPRMIALRCGSGAMSLEELDQLLWINSSLAHPAIVVVVDDEYQADLAVTLFRMGVDDYLSLSHHADRLTAVMRQLLESAPSDALGVQEPAAARLRQTRPVAPASSSWLAAVSIA